MTRITVLYTKVDHIAHLILNRPEADNAVNQQMAQELEAVCCQINQDSDIYVVMVTGTGNKAFCGGGELEAPESIELGEDRPREQRPYRPELVDPKDTELAELRARVAALEALVARLAAPQNGGER